MSDPFLVVEREIFFDAVGSRRSDDCTDFSNENGIRTPRDYYREKGVEIVKLYFTDDDAKNKFILRYV